MYELFDQKTSLQLLFRPNLINQTYNIWVVWKMSYVFFENKLQGGAFFGWKKTKLYRSCGLSLFFMLVKLIKLDELVNELYYGLCEEVGNATLSNPYWR